MILEMKTTRYLPGTAGEINTAYEAALPERNQLSPFGGLFHVDVGVLNTMVELWPYDDAAHRESVQEKAKELKNWPPDLSKVVVEEKTVVLESMPSNGEFEVGAFGGIYEFRMYNVVPGKMSDVISRWSAKIPGRLTLSHFVGAYYINDENAPLLVHIWPYDNAQHRQDIRVEAVKQGLWPPPLVVDGLLTHMENMITVPTSFSPLH